MSISKTFVPIMKDVISNIILLTESLLRKAALLPGSNQGKHLLPDFEIFLHEFFIRKIVPLAPRKKMYLLECLRCNGRPPVLLVAAKGVTFKKLFNLEM